MHTFLWNKNENGEKSICVLDFHWDLRIVYVCCVLFKHPIYHQLWNWANSCAGSYERIVRRWTWTWILFRQPSSQRGTHLPCKRYAQWCRPWAFLKSRDEQNNRQLHCIILYPLFAYVQTIGFSTSFSGGWKTRLYTLNWSSLKQTTTILQPLRL